MRRIEGHHLTIYDYIQALLLQYCAYESYFKQITCVEKQQLQGKAASKRHYSTGRKKVKRSFAKLSMESKESHIAFSLFGEVLQVGPPRYPQTLLPTVTT